MAEKYIPRLQKLYKDEIVSSLLDAHTQIHKHTALSPMGLRPQPVDIHLPNAGNTHKKPIEAQSLDA